MHRVIDYHEEIGNMYDELVKRDGALTPPRNKVSAFLSNSKGEDILPEEVKVIVIGQDPYPRAGLANGYAFAHDKPLKTAGSGMSLFNLVKLAKGSAQRSSTYNLLDWVDQGVILMNRAFTTRVGEPGSHMGEWDAFVRSILYYFLDQNDKIVILTFGAKAFKLVEDMRDINLIHTKHPAVRRPKDKKEFFASDAFNKVNELLVQIGVEAIEW